MKNIVGLDVALTQDEAKALLQVVDSPGWEVFKSYYLRRLIEKDVKALIRQDDERCRGAIKRTQELMELDSRLRNAVQASAA